MSANSLGEYSWPSVGATAFLAGRLVDVAKGAIRQSESSDAVETDVIVATAPSPTMPTLTGHSHRESENGLVAWPRRPSWRTDAGWEQNSWLYIYPFAASSNFNICAWHAFASGDPEPLFPVFLRRQQPRPTIRSVFQ